MPKLRIRSYLFLILILIFHFAAKAIVNTESLRPKYEAGWKGSVSLKGEGSRGNTDKSTYNAEIGVGHFAERETFAIASYSYGESRGVKDAHNSFFHLRHNEKIRDWLKWELFYQWQSDEFKRLEQRQLLGSGLRWGLFESDAASLWTGAGAFAYEERISEHQGIRPYKEESVRGNFYGAFKWSGAMKADILSVVYYQPRLNEMRDYQLLWDLALHTPITEWARVILEYSVSYDSKPPEAVRSNDQTYMAGLQITF